MNKLLMLLSTALCMFLFFRCGCDNPVAPDGDAWPSGLPDWDSSEYDWIDSSYLDWWEYPASPKFALSIFECSPDGQNLIIQNSGNRVSTFNVNSRQFTFLISRLICNADWNSKGDVIGFGFESYDNDDVRYCIFNWHTKDYYYVPAPDTFEDVSSGFKWWGSDTTFLTAFTGYHDKESHRYLVNINPPYNYEFRENLDYNFTSYKNYRYCFSGDSLNHLGRNYHTYLDVKNEKNELLGRYRIDGLTSAWTPVISPNGRYLAFRCFADLKNTKRYKSDMFEFGGLGIIDLQNLNSGNVLYRFFPDYENSMRGKFYSSSISIGSWSADSKRFYHTWYLPDSTVQIVKRDIYSGKVTQLTDLKSAP